MVHNLKYVKTKCLLTDCRFCKFCTVGKAVPGVKVRVVREETNSYGDMVGELLGYGRNLCMGYLNKVSFRLTVSRKIV
jgi:hypothetical protein